MFTPKVEKQLKDNANELEEIGYEIIKISVCKEIGELLQQENFPFVLVREIEGKTLTTEIVIDDKLEALFEIEVD